MRNLIIALIAVLTSTALPAPTQATQTQYLQLDEARKCYDRFEERSQAKSDSNWKRLTELATRDKDYCAPLYSHARDAFNVGIIYADLSNASLHLSDFHSALKHAKDCRNFDPTNYDCALTEIEALIKLEKYSDAVRSISATRKLIQTLRVKYNTEAKPADSSDSTEDTATRLSLLDYADDNLADLIDLLPSQTRHPLESNPINRHTLLFDLVWDQMHGGFHLIQFDRENAQFDESRTFFDEPWFEPRFVDDNVAADFWKSFKQLYSNKDTNGKKLLCECEGEYFKRHGSVFFRIHKARLFAE